MDNAGKYRELREMHKEFIYHGYDIADDGIFFHPKGYDRNSRRAFGIL